MSGNYSCIFCIVQRVWSADDLRISQDICKTLTENDIPNSENNYINLLANYPGTSSDAFVCANAPGKPGRKPFGIKGASCTSEKSTQVNACCRGRLAKSEAHLKAFRKDALPCAVHPGISVPKNID
jgi:hypothetical protein